MSQPLRIVAADDDPAMCLFYEQTLPRLGHQVVARAEQGRARARTALSAFDDVPERATTWFVEDTTEHYMEHQAQIRAFHS